MTPYREGSLCTLFAILSELRFDGWDGTTEALSLNKYVDIWFNRRYQTKFGDDKISIDQQRNTRHKHHNNLENIVWDFNLWETTLFLVSANRLNKDGIMRIRWMD